MLRINLRRELMAVVVVVMALALVGAQPAAAQGFGWREAWDWLAGLWSEAGSLHHQGAGTPQGTVDPALMIAPDGGPTTNGDCGPEIDPSGKCKPLGTGSGG